MDEMNSVGVELSAEQLSDMVEKRDISSMATDEVQALIDDLSAQMGAAARELKFELAGRLRDEIADLKKELRGFAPRQRKFKSQIIIKLEDLLALAEQIKVSEQRRADRGCGLTSAS